MVLSVGGDGSDATPVSDSRPPRRARWSGAVGAGAARPRVVLSRCRRCRGSRPTPVRPATPERQGNRPRRQMRGAVPGCPGRCRWASPPTRGTFDEAGVAGAVVRGVSRVLRALAGRVRRLGGRVDEAGVVGAVERGVGRLLDALVGRVRRLGAAVVGGHAGAVGRGLVGQLDGGTPVVQAERIAGRPGQAAEGEPGEGGAACDELPSGGELHGRSPL